MKIITSLFKISYPCNANPVHSKPNIDVDDQR